MAKLLSFSDESRSALERGVDALADAVRVTIGPRGRNVVLEKKFGAPDIVNDGDSIAREIELDDPFENLGAKLMQQVSSKTKDKAGDGTTTATVLAQAMVREGLRNTAAGASPVELRRGMEKAAAQVVAGLGERSQAVAGDAIRQVATVSSGGDDEVGRMIAEAMDKVSTDGVITVEESKSLATELEITEGMAFDRGYSSPYFVTDSDRQVCEFENPLILLTDRKISTITDLVPVLETVQKSGSPLLILSEEVEGEALATLVMNKSRGVLQVAAVRAPSFGERRKAALADIAILTGGTLISEDKAMTLDKVTLEDLGKARRVTISKESTTIVATDDHRQAVSERVGAIRRELEATESDYDREKLQERLAKLAGGVAVLYVGAATEVEMKEKKDRVDDALHATRAAVEEGIVPGGGTAYIRIASKLGELEGENVDETTGIKIVLRAIEEPLRQIVANAGGEGAVVVNAVREGEGDFGYNARTEVFENLFEAGVIDPTKVTRVALENAVSISGMVLTTECVITDIPEETPAPAAPPMGGGMGGMM